VENGVNLTSKKPEKEKRHAFDAKALVKKVIADYEGVVDYLASK
jgi:hypothetical protein